jgi:hypothetical protein
MKARWSIARVYETEQRRFAIGAQSLFIRFVPCAVCSADLLWTWCRRREIVPSIEEDGETYLRHGVLHETVNPFGIDWALLSEDVMNSLS